MSDHSIIELADVSFADYIIDTPVLVDFWADWCGPCHMLDPELDKIIERYGDRLHVAKLNVDANPKTPQEYGILSIPTVLLFTTLTQRPRRVTGYLPADALAQRLELDRLVGPAGGAAA